MDCALLFEGHVDMSRHCTHHGDHEEEEGKGGQPQVPKGTVLQLAGALSRGLEGDHTAEQLGCDCSPASLQHIPKLFCSSKKRTVYAVRRQNGSLCP